MWADIQFTQRSVASCTELGRILSHRRHKRRPILASPHRSIGRFSSKLGLHIIPKFRFTTALYLTELSQFVLSDVISSEITMKIPPGSNRYAAPAGMHRRPLYMPGCVKAGNYGAKVLRSHSCTPNINTLRTGDADLRFYITTVQDG